jgi:phosphocarrier protein
MKREVTVANRLGLHARAAARFVQLASSFTSRVTVARDGCRVDGKSILGLLTLAAPQGSVLELFADGADEEQALNALASLVDERFGEPG